MNENPEHFEIQDAHPEDIIEPAVIEENKTSPEKSSVGENCPSEKITIKVTDEMGETRLLLSNGFVYKQI